MREVLRVLEVGFGMSLQDGGRVGWRRYGMPVSGAMDEMAAGWANRLVGNEGEVPVLEWCLQGGKLEVLEGCWVGCCGARAGELDWAGRYFEAGEVIEFPRNEGGVWGYVAVAGGFVGEEFFGSASVYERGGLGRKLRVGDVLVGGAGEVGEVRSGLGRRFVPEGERRELVGDEVVEIRVEAGSGMEMFTEGQRELFFGQEWRVGSASDRVGYRLEGELLGEVGSVKSEPVLPGTVQVTTGGLPIVTMVDGPTVGGYAKMAFLERDERERFCQCRPGTRVKFLLE